MKKIISILLAAALAGTLGISAMAETANKGKLDTRLNDLQQRQQRIEQTVTQNQQRQANLKSKQDQFNTFKQAMNEGKQTVLKNRGDNLDIKKQTNELRQTLTKTIKAIKESGKKLPDTVQTQLKGYNTQIKEITDSIKATKGQIKDLMDEYKGYCKNKDYASMDTTLQKISTIQQWRHDQLIQINDILKNMNDLLSQYAAG